MKAHHFDDFARRLAIGGRGRISRRSILRGLGLAATVAGARTLMPAATLAAATQVEPSGPSDPAIAEKAFELEYDIDRIFRFVRDEVGYDAYAGVLRGARGTLWGLAGNAADQTLLLAALLEAALVQTRFVTGELSDEATLRLLVAARLDAQTTRDRAARVFRPPSAAPPAEPTPEVEQLVRDLPGFAQRLQDAVDRRMTDGVATVMDALASVGIDLPEPVAALPDLERRQHVWLQYAAGPNWIDLDPSIPEAESGDVHATVTATLDVLPEELFHQVSFRLVAEQVLGGAPTRQDLLAFEATSSELVGVPINLLHPQPEAMEAVGEGIAGALSGYRNFMPIMIVGEETVSGSPVTFGMSAGVLDALGGGGAVDGDTLAEWLEIDIRTPGGERKIVREVFDRVGAVQRAAGPVDPATVPPIELVEAGDPETSYLPLAGLWSIAVVTGSVPAGYFDRDPAADVGFADLAGIAHAYHFAHNVFALRDTALPGHRIYVDEPNLTAFVMRPTAVAADGQAATTGLDLLYRSLAAAPIDGAVARTHPLLAAGVLGHAIEQAMIESAGEAPMDLPVQAASGVSRVFEEAKRQGVRTLVLRPDASDASLPAVGDAARRRIREALTAGYVVIVPEHTISLAGFERSGWWLVDPATGATVDQMDDGGGSVSSEVAFILIKVSSCALAFVAIAAGVYFAAIGVGLLVVPDLAEGSAYEDDAAAATAARLAAARSAGKKTAGAGIGGTGASAICMAVIA